MFKIGDEVVCTEEHDCNTSIVGESGYIAFFRDNEYLVVFNKNINGHEGWIQEEDRAAGPDGYCWWIPRDSLEHVNFTLENE